MDPVRPTRQRGYGEQASSLADRLLADRLLARRQFCTSAASGFGLAALLSLLNEDKALAQPQAHGTSEPRLPEPHFPPKATSGIFIFLIGGTSQVDMFDPKPMLSRLHGQPIPESFRQGIRLGQTNFNAPLMANRFGFRRYGRCGMEMTELLPHLGACADELALIRSMHHDAFDHAPAELMISTGKANPGRPTVGSWLLYGLGSAARNLPGYVFLMNGRAPKARSLTWGNGFLPANYQGVLFRSQGQPILNLDTPRDVSPALHRAQLDALRRLNQQHQAETGDPDIDARIAAYELAFRMQTAGPELIDLAGETRATLANYTDSNFGRSLLLARRLIERGVRFVTVTHHEWDHHGELYRDLPRACSQIDRPIATLLRDLRQRGLFDSTVVACASEFGRTAITQGNNLASAGRDHHPHAYSAWLTGAGVKRGTVHGATDELGWRVARDPVHIHDFNATLLHLFGLDHRRLTYRHQGLQARLTDVAGEVVHGVLA